MKKFNTRNDNISFADDVLPTPVYLLDTAVEWIQMHLSPEDVFDASALAEWAQENGFTKEKKK